MAASADPCARPRSHPSTLTWGRYGRLYGGDRLVLPQPIEAVVLDFNGTLSADEPLMERIFRELFAEFGIQVTTDFYFAELAGRSDPEIIRAVLERSQLEASQELVLQFAERKVIRYRSAVRKAPTIGPDAVEFVRLLAERLPLAIVSGAQRSEIELGLQLVGIMDCFEAVVCSEDVEIGKPDPAGYLLAQEALNVGRQVKTSGLLAFEDSVPGIRAARAAGMFCLGIVGTTDQALLRREADEVVTALNRDLALRLLDLAL